jgi:hypothetical protein
MTSSHPWTPWVTMLAWHLYIPACAQNIAQHLHLGFWGSASTRRYYPPFSPPICISASPLLLKLKREHFMGFSRALAWPTAHPELEALHG